MRSRFGSAGVNPITEARKGGNAENEREIGLAWGDDRVTIRGSVSSTRFKTLDVRPLLARGEEPYSRIRARVDGIEAGEGLTVVAPFLPAPLIEKLGSEGFRSSVERRRDGAWAVNFWRD